MENASLRLSSFLCVLNVGNFLSVKSDSLITLADASVPFGTYILSFNENISAAAILGECELAALTPAL
jgi:hypothetical protein